MKATDIRAFDDARLQRELGELQAEWRTLRFQEAVGQLTATARIRQIRKDIARIKTIETEREIERETARRDGCDPIVSRVVHLHDRPLAELLLHPLSLLRDFVGRLSPLIKVIGRLATLFQGTLHRQAHVIVAVVP